MAHVIPDPDSHADLESDLARQAWPAMPDAVLERLMEAGTVREMKAGDILFTTGEPGYDFFHLLEGASSILNPTTGEEVVRVEEGNFAGELGMLMCQSAFMDGIMATDGRVLWVDRQVFRDLIRTDPEVSSLVIDAFAARRRLLVEWGEGGLILVGEESDPCCVGLLSFVSRNRIPHTFLDRGRDGDRIAELRSECEIPADGCTAVVGRAKTYHNPSPQQLADAVGLDIKADADRTFDVAIVGAGPSGLGAAVYAASEGLETLIIEDTAIGGQAGTSSRIENYLGFPAGISGTDLAYRAEVQAVKFGAYLTAPRRVERLERREDGTFDLHLNSGDVFRARSVILANGVQYRRLPLDGIERFEGRGIYYAATQLEARFCKDTNAVIVGGGNSAGQAAMFLSRTADCTYMLVRGDGLADTMSSYLSSRIHSDESIELLTETEVVELHGDERLEAVTVRHNPSGDTRRIDSSALFIMIGAVPNTDWLPGEIELDDKGFIVTGQDHACGPYGTTLDGVYAVGDVRADSVKRVASAAGEGAVVVSFVHGYLAGHGQPELDDVGTKDAAE